MYKNEYVYMPANADNKSCPAWTLRFGNYIAKHCENMYSKEGGRPSEALLDIIIFWNDVLPKRSSEPETL